MAFPATTDSTDPTSQIPWPGRPHNVRNSESGAQSGGHDPTEPDGDGLSPARQSTTDTVSTRHMSTLNLFTLSVSMGGSQMAWIVELAYGTPFLVALGMSEQMTSLVWLAGPISGLVAQPLIGAISDSSTSSFRRRKWIIWSTAIIVVAIFMLSFAMEISGLLMDMLGVGEGDWDPKRNARVKATSMGIAVVAFFLLDFALNGLQASLRNLLLDVTPAEQLNQANAWHGRMLHAGSIIGNGIGFMNLGTWPLLAWLGGDQFRKFSVIVVLALVVTVATTCIMHPETGKTDELRRPERVSIAAIFGNIFKSIKNLPKPIRRVCYVQVFAWMGWFPFLFFSTLWVGEVMARELHIDPDKDRATRAGEFALFLYSITAALSGWLLPFLTKRERTLLVVEDIPAHNGEDQELARIRDIVRRWKAEAARQGKKLLLPKMPFMLRNIWTVALAFFVFLMTLTVFVRSVLQATILITALGICWSVAMWVPFAIIMEYLKGREIPGVEQTQQTGTASRRHHRRQQSLPTPTWRSRTADSERSPLIRSRSQIFEADELEETDGPIAGGTILGIHNLAVVIPQFIIAIISSAIFRVVDKQEPGNEHLYLGKNGVTWVLAFGGFCAIIAAVMSRRVPPTRHEKEIRQKLAEIKEAQELGLA